MANQVKVLYSYTIKVDIGFAPNPFGGVCTLACCKPKIRESVADRVKKTANIDNLLVLRKEIPDYIREQAIWVLAMASRRLSNIKNIAYRSVVFLMQVTDIMDFETYYKEYPRKRPNRSNKDSEKYYGDNIYTKNSPSETRQLPSEHSNKDCTPNNSRILHDHNSKYVLLSDHFIYFGEKTETVSFADDLIVGRGHKFNHKPETLSALEELLDGDWNMYFTESPGLASHRAKNSKECTICD